MTLRAQGPQDAPGSLSGIHHFVDAQLCSLVLVSPKGISPAELEAFEKPRECSAYRMDLGPSHPSACIDTFQLGYVTDVSRRAAGNMLCHTYHSPAT